MRFQDLSIKSKQRIAIGLVLVVVGASSLFALQRMQDMKEDIDEVSGFWLNRAETLGLLSINVALVRLNQVQMAATSDADRRREYAQGAVRRLDSVAVYWDKYTAIRLDSLERRLDPDEEPWAIRESETFQSLEDSWDAYLGELLFFLDPDEQLDEATRTRIFDETENEFIEVAENLGELFDINNSAWKVSEQRAAENFEDWRYVTRLLLIAAVLLSLAITTILVRLISKPVTELTRAAERVSKGDRSVYIPVDSGDEIGRLSKSFNHMTHALREQEAELVRRQEETAQKNAELEATLDKLKATQQQLVVREKMASLGQLTAGIAHEIKNPLNFVNNFAKMSRELTDELIDDLETQKGKKVEDVLPVIQDLVSDLSFNADRIREHGSRADSIVKNMLLHSRGKPGEHVLTDLNALMDEYVHLAFHGMRGEDANFNASFSAELDDTIGEIDIVRGSFGRALLNILNNAFYAVGERSKSAGRDYEPTVVVRTKRVGGRVEISIEDNGSGIPKENVDRIFEPFFTTKPTGSGTGLGLSLSYDIITEEHGGEMRVETEVDKGTTFVISLPLKA